MENKNDIRKYIKILFTQNIYQDREEQDLVIERDVIEYIETSDIRDICIYEHMDDEVKTDTLIEKLLQTGKMVYSPKIISPCEMQLQEYNSREKYTGKIDIFIVPGRAFSRDGKKRLGRGKGYYDRFLAKKQYKDSEKVGICYDFQILEDIPTQCHDIEMNYIISA